MPLYISGNGRYIWSEKPFKISVSGDEIIIESDYDIILDESGKTLKDAYLNAMKKEQAKEQYRHLIDEEKLKSTEFRYGKITKKVVIYRGENTTLENGIEYRNVEEYLKSLV